MDSLRGWRPLSRNQACVSLLATSVGLWAYRLYACSVCDMNSVLEIISGRYATNSLNYLLT